MKQGHVSHPEVVSRIGTYIAIMAGAPGYRRLRIVCVAIGTAAAVFFAPVGPTKATPAKCSLSDGCYQSGTINFGEAGTATLTLTDMATDEDGTFLWGLYGGYVCQGLGGCHTWIWAWIDCSNGHILSMDAFPV